MIATIEGLQEVNVAMENEPAEMKMVVWFHELDKPMVLNSTNAQIIAAIIGSEETDDWPGKTIELYHERMIQYAGRMVGGIRARMPGGAHAQPLPSRKAQTPLARGGAGGFQRQGAAGLQRPVQQAAGLQRPQGGTQRPGRQVADGQQSPFNGPPQGIPQDDPEPSDNDGAL